MFIKGLGSVPFPPADWSEYGTTLRTQRFGVLLGYIDPFKNVYCTFPSKNIQSWRNNLCADTWMIHINDSQEGQQCGTGAD